MKLLPEVINYIQSQYVAHKYTEGMYVFSALEEDVIDVVVDSFIKWAQENGIVIDDTMDLSKLFEKGVTTDE